MYVMVETVKKFKNKKFGFLNKKKFALIKADETSRKAKKTS